MLAGCRVIGAGTYEVIDTVCKKKLKVKIICETGLICQKMVNACTMDDSCGPSSLLRGYLSKT
jgi:hypothetical protein